MGTIAEGCEDLDVVIAVSTTNELSSFLDSWRPILSLYHIVIVAPSTEAVQVPDGFSHRLYTYHDIELTVPSSDLASALTTSPHASRSFGFLVSTKRYIFTLDTDCSPAKDPVTGSLIDPVARHLQNLKQNSTPFFFNTLYDPYRDGTDFVRGYPFSLREGVPSAISHGLWLNVPDLDAPTRIVKPHLLNRSYVDAVLTVPKGSLLPMSSINLAFDRKYVGAAMFFGLRSLSGSTRYAAFDDIWAGLCSKAICDHLGLGVKSGLPYVWRNESTSARALEALQHVPQGVQWLERLLPFFQSLRFPRTAVTVQDCYLEIAKQIKDGKLNSLDPWFQHVGGLMESWIQIWNSHSG
ncbi:hypothetical protein KP509_33G007800 [Ceratopteris richardii]|uniref:Reversibly glycosylated polypeptide family n=1 Tax=Ceratopteris richardii TaxID=49495 RepID=A0A8T2QND9_CERRI|nr:hypothetical protein KP509_33G007800 [Ceratopteris richardii]KAH7285016.1 hypothetical protein KP509_33G007800 [Ceratopteris richardii]